MKLHNTLTRRLEEFQPLGDPVRMYVCGVTPYDENHIGHAMSYIVFDVLRRYLEHRGYRVHHVQNFTDIDDRIIARAARLGVSTQELAQRFIDRYFEDMDDLHVLRAHEYPRATLEVPAMIEMIGGLLERGYAYAVDGDVYYRVRRKADYGRLSNRNLEDMVARARVEPGEAKENPMDFALWKAAKPGEPSWDSPWGPGRPGWHIECSAMSLKYLGEQIDIHGGGEDLIFPHHENEIAQTEAYTGKTPFVRYWLHNAWVKMGEEKMSKSLGNFVPVRQVVERYGADAVRLFVLTSHYRKPLTYSEEALESAMRGVERLRTAFAGRAADFGELTRAEPAPVGDGTAGGSVDASPYGERFLAAMDDDLNTSGALAALFDLAREINRAHDEGRPSASAQETLQELAGVLGLTLEEREVPTEAAPFKKLLVEVRDGLGVTDVVVAIPEEREGPADAATYIDLLVRVRDELRRAGRFDLADSIRARLGELGVALEDTAQGTVWKRRD